MRQIRCSDSSSMVQEGGQRDRQERTPSGSWAVSAGSQAVAQDSGSEGIKLGVNYQSTSSGKRVTRLLASSVFLPHAKVFTHQFPLHSALLQSSEPPSQDLLENQEGPRGRGKRMLVALKGQEDHVSTFRALPFIPKTSTCQSAINNQESE